MRQQNAAYTAVPVPSPQPQGGFGETDSSLAPVPGFTSPTGIKSIVTPQKNKNIWTHPKWWFETELGIPHQLASCNLCPFHCRARGQLRLRGSCLASWPRCYGHHPVTSGTGELCWHCSPHKALGSSHLWTFQPVSGCNHVKKHAACAQEFRRKYTLALPFQEEAAAACCPVSSPRTTCPYPRVTPSLVSEPRPFPPTLCLPPL